MKILVLGAGALGGYYGARLIEAGADVTFLVRPHRAKLLAENGLVIRSAMGDFSQKVATVVANEITRPYDAILVTCKAYDLDGAVEAIAPAVGSETVIIPLLNGLCAYDTLDKRFGVERVMGGVSYIATNLMKTGEIVHLSPFDRFYIGARHSAQTIKAQTFYELASKSSGTRELSAHIEQDLWEKWVMISAGAAITCLMRATIGDIMKTKGGAEAIAAVLDECESVARATGYELRPNAKKSARATLLDSGSTWAASMMRDIDAGAPRIEADAIVGDMIQRGRRLNVSTRLLEFAYVHLQTYEQRRNAQ